MNTKHETEKRRPSDLERLLEDIQNGEFDAASDLTEVEIEMLRRHYGHEEDLQDLLDRLRGAGPSER